MMTVRFPNGFSVQYNTANYVIHGPDHNILRTKENGDFIAVVPKEAIVEAVQPCRMYQVANRNDNEELQRLAKEVRLLKRYIAKSLKATK